MPIDYSPPCIQELPEENFTEVVLLTALHVRKCQGCKEEIIRTKCAPPKDLVFACRHFKYGKTKEW